MSKISKNVSYEKRRIRWNTTGKTTKAFFATLFVMAVFVLFIGLFTFGMGHLMALA